MAQDVELVKVGEEVVVFPEDENVNDQYMAAMKSSNHHVRKI